MLALAIADRPDWTIYFDELDREPPSYTIETLAAIAARHPGDELWLLMGTDSSRDSTAGGNPEILRMARMAAFHREPFAGYPRSALPKSRGSRIGCPFSTPVRLEFPRRRFRSDLAAGRACREVPEPVAEYITKQGLYRPGDARALIPDLPPRKRCARV